MGRHLKGFYSNFEFQSPSNCTGRIAISNLSLYFPSYTDKKETEKKIISQVFIKDDKAFLTGDLMFSDEENYLYFADRVGDTFRWKG